MKIAVVFTKRDRIAEVYPQDWKGRNENNDADSVIKALKELGHEVISYNADLGLFEKLRKNKKNIEIVFNLCDDGFFSNPEFEPHLPAMLEVLGLPYTGGDYLAIALTLKKDATKKILMQNNLPTPKFEIFEQASKKINLRYPLIVKPIREDASIGITDDSIVYDEENLRKRAQYIIDNYNQPALVEEFIDGREFNVAIIGDNEILPISEIQFNGLPKGKPHIINYDAKWKKGSIDYKETRRACPADLDRTLAKKLTEIALKAGSLFGCRDYFRVDLRVDKNNNPYILEINQNPDLSEDDGLASIAKAKGYSYKELLAKILKSAAARKDRDNT